MVHYKIEQQANTDLYTNYPHDPSDLDASMLDYFEDLLSQGWELAAKDNIGSNNWRFIFRCVGRS